MKDHLTRVHYCRWCYPTLTRADLATVYEYTVDVRPDGTPIRGRLRLCQACARRVDFVRYLVVMGHCTDWEGRVCHDVKALDRPLRDH